jgi:hypothetical protein
VLLTCACCLQEEFAQAGAAKASVAASCEFSELAEVELQSHSIAVEAVLQSWFLVEAAAT